MQGAKKCVKNARLDVLKITRNVFFEGINERRECLHKGVVDGFYKPN